MPAKPRGPAGPGPGVDAQGLPVLDPTFNVLSTLEAAVKRQDDLREAESRHVREVAKLRAEYAGELRKAESDRIDAIRAVDVGAVNRAAEVSAIQATTLANQVATSAEALRGQVEAARQQTAAALSAALEPIIRDIADLRKSQYEQQGQRAEVVDRRGGNSLGALIASVGVGFLLLVVAIVGTYLAAHR